MEKLFLSESVKLNLLGTSIFPILLVKLVEPLIVRLLITIDFFSIFFNSAIGVLVT